MAPGPGLAAALATVDPQGVSGYDSVEVLRAAQRQQNAARATTLDAVVEVALRRPGSEDTVERLQVPHPHAADEIRAALGISAPAADKLLSLAWDTVRRLPELHQAMACGGLDETRAWAFAEWTTELSDEHAHAVCAELLPRAVLDAEEQLPTGSLIKEIQKTAIALDPTWAERRYSESLRKRRVVGRANPDGTANLHGQQLELHRVAAACGRLNTLARRAKKAGDPRPIDHLRSDLYLGMLDGTYEALSDAEILAALARTRPEHNDDAEGAERAGTVGPDMIADQVPVPAEPAPAPAPPHPAESSYREVQLRIRMTTLLGLDRAPAEIADWGPINVDYGRMLTALMAAARWRYVLTDDEGRFRSAGLIRMRPEGWNRRNARNHGIVDLLVPESLLRDLVIGPLDGIELVDHERYRAWLPVLRELADRMLRPNPLPDDSNRRFPGRGLRRVVELDKLRCVGVGCGRSAHRCELDHNLDWAKRGRTVGVNLSPACGRDHRLKTKGGWTLHSWRPNGYRWCTPLGREYVVSIPRVIEKVAVPPPDLWICDHTGRDEPNGELDDEGVPWQASTMWFSHGRGPASADLGGHERRRPSVLDVISRWKPATTGDEPTDPPF
jgi:hypothetical protein